MPSEGISPGSGGCCGCLLGEGETQREEGISRRTLHEEWDGGEDFSVGKGGLTAS
ncbi:hypothetical protein HPP92_023064 [Vanilla planifolia]|uniref:Uncharacterized protein n=1 Tax=Vanilla planifolia TaxID=51239 RepID=A0A835PT96_VANPL|nr:hypothetical protein HPP92_023064 [Vanilla planifolia]